MIQPTSNFLGFNRGDAIGSATPKAAPTTSSTAESGDRLLSLNSDALHAALKSTPEIRPDVVARGQDLRVDLNYPSREIIRGLSRLFINSTDLSEQS